MIFFLTNTIVANSRCSNIPECSGCLLCHMTIMWRPIAGSIKIQSILKSPDRTTNTPKSLQHLPKQGWLLPNWYSYLPKLAGNSQSRLETLPNSARKLPKLAGNSQS